MLIINQARVFKQILQSIHRRYVTTTNVPDWNVVLANAEKVIGYPTSFLNLRWILNDQVANFASHLMKLLETNHPLVEIGRNFLIQKQSPPFGLVVLLMSKMAGTKRKLTCDEMGVGILREQRIVAEVAEMLNTSNQMHNGITKVGSNVNDETRASLLYGNKVALLCGDYLLSKCYSSLAECKNPDAYIIISSSLNDLAEYEFFGPWDSNNHPLPSKPVKNKQKSKIFDADNCDQGPYEIDKVQGNYKDEWVLRNILYRGNLLGKSCKTAMLFSELSYEFQDQAYLFGKNFMLAQRAHDEYKEFIGGNEKFNLIGAPVMLQLHNDPSLYTEIEKGLESIDDCNYGVIRKIIERGKGLDDTCALINVYVERGLKNLESFEDNDSKLMLQNMISLLKI